MLSGTNDGLISHWKTKVVNEVETLEKRKPLPPKVLSGTNDDLIPHWKTKIIDEVETES